MVDSVHEERAAGLLSQGAYARSRGWSPQYVSKLVQQGKIPLVSGKVDAVAADASLARLRDGNREAVRMANAQRRAASIRGVPADAPVYAENPLSRATLADKSLSARLKQLEVDERTGKACLTERVIKAVGDNQATTAQMLDQMVERCFAQIAAETDPGKVRLMMLAEVREVKAEISNFARSLPERVTATAQ